MRTGSSDQDSPSSSATESKFFGLRVHIQIQVGRDVGTVQIVVDFDIVDRLVGQINHVVLMWSRVVFQFVQ